MNDITFIIFAFNEEKRIHFPLKLFSKYGNVILVDNSSTDDTKKIAVKYGARIINRKKTNHEMVVTESKEMADFVFKYVKTEWVYWGYADEIMSEKCILKYIDIINRNNKKIIIQNYLTYLYGSNRPFMYQMFSFRVFKKNAIKFYPQNKSIHKIGEIHKNISEDEIEFLGNDPDYSIHHFSVYNTKKLIANHNMYSDIHSNVLPSNFRIINLIMKPFFNFLNLYFYHRNFLNGINGFIASVQYSYYSFIVEVKRYENIKDINLDSIEEKFSKYKKLFFNTGFTIKSKKEFYLFSKFSKFLNKKILIPIFLRKNKVR